MQTFSIFLLRSENILSSLVRRFSLKLITCITLAVSLYSQSSLAVGISTYRIYMDLDKRDYNFIVYNRDTYAQSCNIGLRHYDIDETGKISLNTDAELPSNSAAPWIRFSPKSFKIKPGQTQSVKFLMRRRANQEATEYRSYLALDCEYTKEELEKLKETQKILPKLRHNVPIIVRTGKINADISFDKIVLTNDSITFNVNRKGQRSVYGDIELINSTTNEIVDKKPLVAIYPETPHLTYTLQTKGIQANNLKLRFAEDSDGGGKLVAEQFVNQP